MLLGIKDLMVNEVGVQNEKWLVDRLKKAPFYALGKGSFLVYDVRRFVFYEKCLVISFKSPGLASIASCEYAMCNGNHLVQVCRLHLQFLF